MDEEADLSYFFDLSNTEDDLISEMCIWCTKHWFTDYTLWKQLATEKARIEDQFATRLRKWVNNVNNSINAILSYKEPHLLKSLQAEMVVNSMRADQAERDAMAYTRFSRHLDRDFCTNTAEEFKEHLKIYKQLLKSVDRVSKESKYTEQKFERSITKLNDHVASIDSLNESLQAVTPELHDKVAHAQTKIDKIRSKLQKAKRAKSTLLEEVVKQSDHVMNAWLFMESQKLELLTKEWRQCLVAKRLCVPDIKAWESDSLKFSDMVAVTEFLDQLASAITKELKISKPDDEGRDSDSMNNVYKNDAETSIVEKISKNAENVNSTPRKTASSFSFHRPNAVSDIGSSQASIEGIDCDDVLTTGASPQGVRKIFLPEPTAQTTEERIAERPDNPKQELIPVVAVKSYKKQSSQEISLECGQKLEMYPAGPRVEMAYGIKKCRLTSGEKDYTES